MKTAPVKTRVPRRRPAGRQLKDLRNIGPAMLKDFDVLGLKTVEQLARSDAHQLYLQLQKKTGRRHDPCVWDVFAAAIHEARTGEPLDWWKFTPQRKAASPAKSSF
jgi:hypothetical protein